MCVQNLIFVALPTPGVIGVALTKNEASHWIRPRSLFSKIFNGLLYGWTLRMYWPNLKSVAQEWVKLSEIIAIGVLGGSCEPNLQERVGRSLRGREWYLVFSVLHFRRIRAASLKPIMFKGLVKGSLLRSNP